MSRPTNDRLRFHDFIRMDAFLIGYAALCSLIFAQAALMFVNAWEQGRFHSGRRAAPLGRDYTPSVRLVIPCKGLDLELHANLQALFELDYPQLELCFVVETADEPATEVIRSLQENYPLASCHIVCAGRAELSGQKVHNLIAATRTIPAEIEVLAFVDSDARPHREWLLRLVQRLENGKRAIATGYRWLRPARATWTNELLSAINNIIVGQFGPHGFVQAWGGAWAIKVDTFRRLGLPTKWEGTLSDDLVVSRLALESNLKIGYEPHCLVNSSIDVSPASLAEFLRRQYLVVRVYSPRWWWSGLAIGTILNGAFWGSLVLAVAWSVSGQAWWLPAGAVVLQYLLAAGRNALSVQVFEPFTRVPKPEFHRVSRWNVWGWPLVGLINWLGLLASLAGRSIVWRGIHYKLVSSRCTEVSFPGGKPTSTRHTQAQAA